MAVIKFKPNDKGIQEMLKSAKMQSVLESKAEQALSIAGGDSDNFEFDTKIGFDRAHVYIKPKSKEGYRQVYEDNVLEKVSEQFAENRK